MDYGDNYLLTIHDVCVMTRMGRSTVYKKNESGCFPPAHPTRTADGEVAALGGRSLDPVLPSGMNSFRTAETGLVGGLL